MDYLTTSRIVARVIAEVGGTIATNGIQELDRTERGGVSAFGYVRVCLMATAYNAVRALPGFSYSYNEFCRAVEKETHSRSLKSANNTTVTAEDGCFPALS